MNATTENFILFAGNTGHRFHPFTAETWEQAEAEAVRLGWVVDDHQVDADGTQVISVIPKSMITHLIAPVIPIR